MTIAPVILGVETATRGGSVCLLAGDEVLALAEGDPSISHSNTLLSDVKECLDQAGLSVKDINLFAAASGPGSFTGLRIGLATVKAFAATLGQPCIGIPTLHAIAHGAGPSRATLVLLPAGRGELFVQLLSVSSQGEITELDTAAHLVPQRVFEKYGSLTNLKWAGPGAHLHRALIGDAAGAREVEFIDESGSEGGEAEQKGWSLAPEQKRLAKNVAALALQQFLSGNVTGAQSVKAIYVRPSDAELKCQ
jgi:tRNA threonylcarbamoyladenosine biosynthesis protein TsaB